MLEWFQEQQKTVHCYNAKDKKGNSVCRADFPSKQSEHFRLCFPCPDALVTGEVRPGQGLVSQRRLTALLWTVSCFPSLQAWQAQTLFGKGKRAMLFHLHSTFPSFLILRATVGWTLSLNSISNSYVNPTKQSHRLEEKTDANKIKFKRADTTGDRNGACTLLLSFKIQWPFIWQGVAWFGRMKNVGNNRLKILWSKSPPRKKKWCLERNGELQGGEHLDETENKRFLVNVLSFKIMSGAREDRIWACLEVPQISFKKRHTVKDWDE